MSEDDFQVVKPRRQRINKNHKKYDNLVNRLEVIGCDLHDIVRETAQSLRKHLARVYEQGIHLNKGLDKINLSEIVIYGIGDYSSCYISRRQLAFILRLLKEIEHCGKVLVFDPVLSDEDYNFLQENYSIEKITNNEECKRTATSKTLFFMPHLDKSLYNNLLWSNWMKNHDRSNLSNVIILGNSVTHMRDKLADRIFKSEYRYLHFVCENDMIVESLLDFIDSFDDAFNDLSLMTFKTVCYGQDEDKSASCSPFQMMQSAYSRQDPVYSTQEEVVLSDKRPDDPEDGRGNNEL
jgi:hypothetical protein